MKVDLQFVYKQMVRNYQNLVKVKMSDKYEMTDEKKRRRNRLFDALDIFEMLGVNRSEESRD